MNKIEEARSILKDLNVPVKQQSDMCCLTLLAMANLKEQDSWQGAKNEWIRIHDIIQLIHRYYSVTYAENSRETIRKQAVHHFRNAAFIEDKEYATNSPNYCYRLTDEFLSLISCYGTDSWNNQKEQFLLGHESLINIYNSKKMRIPAMF